MKPFNRNFVSFQCVTALVMLLLTLISCQAWAQPSSTRPASTTDTGKTAQEMHVVELSVDLNDDRTAEVVLEFESSLEKKFNSPQLLSTSLDCQLRGMELTRDMEGNTTILSAECDIPVRRSHFAESESIDVRPLIAILMFEPQSDFFLRISVPNHDFVRCDPAPTEFHQAADSGTCLYISKSADRIPESIKFQSGYRWGHVARMTGFLGFLLLLPVAATFWFRRRCRLSSEETRPAIWFAYRRFLTWTALFGALLWWATVDLLQADELVKFLLPVPKWSDAFAFAAIPWILLWLPPA